MKEEDDEIVYEFVAMYVTVWIPNLSLERILVSDLFTFVQYLTPSYGHDTILGDIVYRYVFRSNRKTLYVSDR